MFSCVLSCLNETKKLLPNVFYEISKVRNEETFVFGLTNEIPLCVNFYELLNFTNTNPNIEKVTIEGDTFIFLKPLKILSSDFVCLKNGNDHIDILLDNKIKIKVNNEIVFEKFLITEIAFSHLEKKSNYEILYFTGVRNFVVILQNGKVQFADYYDEINIEKEDRYFMCRKNDILNHGEVASLKDGKFEKYLVYLDDYELKMKNEFVFVVFLDCFLCGNLKYCNKLLCDEIKQTDEKAIKKFFNEFDMFVPYKDVAFTFKKNTLSGVYKFNVKNNKIENIIHLMQCD